MAKDSSGVIILGLGAAVAVYGYTQGWFSSLFGSAAAAPASAAGGSGVSTSGGSTATGGGVTPTAASTPTAPSQPSYSGPSLDQMFQALQSAVGAAYGGDPALTCGGGGSLSGFGVLATKTPGGMNPGSGVQVIKAIGSRPSYGIVMNAPRTTATSDGTGAPTSAPSCPALNVIATYDVFNWYLVAAVPSIGTAPSPPDHTSQISLQDYWTWAAPQLKQQIPGLAGGFNGGLGAYAELSMILQRQRDGY